jgi:hypothetical protein
MRDPDRINNIYQCKSIVNEHNLTIIKLTGYSISVIAMMVSTCYTLPYKLHTFLRKLHTLETK